MTGRPAGVPETPVPALDAATERQLLADLGAAPPAVVLVVSDLHLSKGIDPATGRYCRRENFFAGDAFGRFLRHHVPAEGAAGLLVLNGDIFDFLRIDDVPGTAVARDRWVLQLARLGWYQTPPVPTGHERRFGLQTDAASSQFKLQVIADGHPGFFRALADWLGAGGSVLYVKGNHDVEQHWPLVRRAFRDLIHQAGAPADLTATRVLFADDVARIGNLRIDHGHQYEPMTSVQGPPEIPGSPPTIALPLGSFVNRYIVNQLERVEPFLDNIKPVSDVLREMVKRRPLTLFGIFRGGTRLLARALVRRRVKHVMLALAILASVLLYLAPAIAIVAVVLFFTWTGFRDWILSFPLLASPTVRTVLSVVGVVLPFLQAAVRELMAWWKRPRIAEDHEAERAYLALRAEKSPVAWQRRYSVVGHTHRQDVQVLPAVDGAEVVYVNSGTWIPRWPKDRPDLIGRVYYSFLRFTGHGGEYRHESLVWDDARGAPQPAEMLTPN